MSSYHVKIFDPKKITSHEKDISNQLFKSWDEVFSKVVEKAGGVLDPDDYFRNDFAVVIYDKEKILGFTLCTEFDLRLMACQKHHYWRAIAPSTIEKLAGQNLNRIGSIEYLTIMPEFRKTAADIPWAEVILGLALLYQDNSHLDAMIGTPRIDIKMDETCARTGAFFLQEPIMKMNYSCAVQLWSKTNPGKKRKFDNLLTHKWSHELWNNCENFKNINVPSTNRKTA